MLAAIDLHQPALVFIAYPNNPTGNCFSRDAIEAILRRAPGLVVLDEAYEPFAPDSWLPRLAEFPNLAIMRTLSKLGLAGARLGYLAAAHDWTDQTREGSSALQRRRAQRGGGAVRARACARSSPSRRSAIREERENLLRELRRLVGQGLDTRFRFAGEFRPGYGCAGASAAPAAALAAGAPAGASSPGGCGNPAC